jgi:hypothetical protein
MSDLSWIPTYCADFLLGWMCFIMKQFHPPTQEATAVKLWRNAERVSSEALAKEGPLRRGVAEDTKGTTAVKPWGSTKLLRVTDWRRDQLDLIRTGKPVGNAFINALSGWFIT